MMLLLKVKNKEINWERLHPKWVLKLSVLPTRQVGGTVNKRLMLMSTGKHPSYIS